MLAATLLLSGCSTGEPTAEHAPELAPGPLNRPNEHAWAIIRPAGTTFTDGMEMLRLNGDRRR